MTQPAAARGHWLADWREIWITFSRGEHVRRPWCSVRRLHHNTVHYTVTRFQHMVQNLFCLVDLLPLPWSWASAHRGKWGQLTPHGKMDEKLKSENMQKKSSFLCLCYILRAIRAGKCRERRYADHIFIQIYFRMHHFVVKFSSPQAARGHWPQKPCGRSCDHDPS